ncbi:hypothetical protein DXG01_013200, partial [Tephrocybe rancida]
PQDRKLFCQRVQFPTGANLYDGTPQDAIHGARSRSASIYSNSTNSFLGTAEDEPWYMENTGPVGMVFGTDSVDHNMGNSTESLDNGLGVDEFCLQATGAAHSCTVIGKVGEGGGGGGGGEEGPGKARASSAKEGATKTSPHAGGAERRGRRASTTTTSRARLLGDSLITDLCNGADDDKDEGRAKE